MVIPKRGHAKGLAAFVISLGVFGTALLYGDGLITPAISVLSAVDGVKTATSAFDHIIVPMACVILIGLFVVQTTGHGRRSAGCSGRS